MNRRDLLRAIALVLGGSISASAARMAVAADQVHAQGTDAAEAWQHQTVTSILSELIIPATDTPGAITAGVPEFIQSIYLNWYSEPERLQFDVGLAELNTLSQAEYDHKFSECTQTQQTALLQLAESAGEESGLNLFFTSIKELTVVGYYTSAVGATQELSFNPVPMKYKGDYLFADIGRQWSY